MGFAKSTYLRNGVALHTPNALQSAQTRYPHTETSSDWLGERVGNERGEETVLVCLICVRALFHVFTVSSARVREKLGVPAVCCNMLGFTGGVVRPWAVSASAAMLHH